MMLPVLGFVALFLFGALALGLVLFWAFRDALREYRTARRARKLETEKRKAMPAKAKKEKRAGLSESTWI